MECSKKIQSIVGWQSLTHKVWKGTIEKSRDCIFNRGVSLLLSILWVSVTQMHIQCIGSLWTTMVRFSNVYKQQKNIKTTKIYEECNPCVLHIYNDLLISWLWMLVIGVWAESKVIYSCTSWNDYLATSRKAFFGVRSECFAYHWLVQASLKTIASEGLYHIPVFRSKANFGFLGILPISYRSWS